MEKQPSDWTIIFPYELDTRACVSNVLLWLATYTNWFIILPLDVTSIGNFKIFPPDVTPNHLLSSTPTPPPSSSSFLLLLPLSHHLVIFMCVLVLSIVMDEYIAIYGNEKSIAIVYCYGLFLWLWSIVSLIKCIV